MIRLFVAIDLPDEVRRHLALLSGGIPGARWMEPGSYHVTLRFIGEVAEDTAEDIHAALDSIHVPAFELGLGGVGAFSQGHRAHTLFAGVDRTQPLQHLHDKIDRAVTRLGLPPDGRKFAPHITLARLKDAAPDKIQDFLATNNLFRHGPFPVARFTLFSSHLGRSGAVYTAEADYALEMAGTE